MNCGDARRLFGGYWDDEVTIAEREWLEQHFNACAACRTEYEDLARTLELVGSLPRTEVSPGLAGRALARARRAAAVPDRLPAGSPRWIPITATAALLAIAATMTLQWLGITPAGRPGGGSEVAVISEPVRVFPADGRPVDARLPDTAGRSAAATDLQAAALAPDSLFDHSADVEFILDPVTLRRGRVQVAPRLNPDLSSEKVVITF